MKTVRLSPKITGVKGLFQSLDHFDQWRSFIFQDESFPLNVNLYKIQMCSEAFLNMYR